MIKYQDIDLAGLRLGYHIGMAVSVDISDSDNLPEGLTGQRARCELAGIVEAQKINLTI